MQGSFLGPCFDDNEIARRLTDTGAVFSHLETPALINRCTELLSKGFTLAWFQGRMEFGPRALGGRSILADPRSPKMQRRLNLKIKKRESFRPFAPAVLAETCSAWFDTHDCSPYMLFTAPVSRSKRTSQNTRADSADLRVAGGHSAIPAVTHVDFSARVQTVDKNVHPLFHELISSFAEKTGCPILLNTSFNVRGEPIVCTPEDAFRCFMNTELDYLVVGNNLIARTDQDQLIAISCMKEFTPD